MKDSDDVKEVLEEHLKTILFIDKKQVTISGGNGIASMVIPQGNYNLDSFDIHTIIESLLPYLTREQRINLCVSLGTKGRIERDSE